MYVCSVLRSEGGNEYTVYDELGSKYQISGGDLRRLEIPFTGREEDYPVEMADSLRELLSECHEKLRCIKYLQWYIESYGEKSKKRFLEKCRENDYSAGVANTAIELLCEYGVIDEIRSCERRIVAYARDKLYGKFRIKNELYAKGYEKASIEAAFENSEVDFYENAVLMYRKLTRNGVPSDFKERRKIADKMVRYGYSFDEIKYASSEVYGEGEVFDD